ncbi:hypothetical protein OSB04_016363 [Centaurea solstitialis]|uniref:Uncharacterized protein n=1 Tax=Centaurea solstitialis TaxID=347529 RepID=A0AA38T8I1_9ASTR|nr:hypothetical protein OSB04_016363 [Centaurea solstitialis]
MKEKEHWKSWNSRTCPNTAYDNIRYAKNGKASRKWKISIATIGMPTGKGHMAKETRKGRMVDFGLTPRIDFGFPYGSQRGGSYQGKERLRHAGFELSRLSSNSVEGCTRAYKQVLGSSQSHWKRSKCTIMSYVYTNGKYQSLSTFWPIVQGTIFLKSMCIYSIYLTFSNELIFLNYTDLLPTIGPIVKLLEKY